MRDGGVGWVGRRKVDLVDGDEVDEEFSTRPY
jgi:hypothetical protein